MSRPDDSADGPSRLAERLASVREEVRNAEASAGRPPGGVRLVAVTKGHSAETVEELARLGVCDFGENRTHELASKHSALGAGGAGGSLRWHFIGGLQRNKVKQAADSVWLWHTVDRADLGREIARRAPGSRVLVEVNLGAEPQKAGVAPAALAGLVAELRQEDLRVVGLMCIPPASEPPRPHFARLRELAQGEGLSELSMGMSGDFAEAIAEGSTIVRIGTRLVGPRPAMGNP